MASLNRIVLVGTLSSEPDIQVTTAGDPFSKFKLSVVRPTRDSDTSDRVDIIDVVTWRESAERMKSQKKGNTILVEGRVITRSFDDNDGNRRWVTEVDARYIKPLVANQSAADIDASVSSLEEKTADDTPFNFDQQGAETATLQAVPNFTEEIEEDIPF